jgi:hypothetical protein
VRAPGRLGEGPGALFRNGSPPSPAETGQRYSKRSPLTVLFRAQVPKLFADINQATPWGRSEVEAFLGTGPPPLTTKHP